MNLFPALFPALFPDESRLPAPYINPRQAQSHTPDAYENLLADALEAAFAAGAWDLKDLVERLNADGIRTPEGGEWTVGNFEIIINQLGSR